MSKKFPVITMKSRIKKLRIKMLMKKLREGKLETAKEAGMAIRMRAKQSIKKVAGESSPGSPPHTHRGILKRSILYSVDRQRGSVIIGANYRYMGMAAHYHEYGGKYKRSRYPARPFMRPALQRVLPQVPRYWQHRFK